MQRTERFTKPTIVFALSLVVIEHGSSCLILRDWNTKMLVHTELRVLRLHESVTLVTYIFRFNPECKSLFHPEFKTLFH